MQISGSGRIGYHPDARVKMSHPSYLSGMRRNKIWMMLYSPEVFKVGMSGKGCVGVSVHIDKVGDDKKVGKADSVLDESRRRVQIGC